MYTAPDCAARAALQAPIRQCRGSRGSLAFLWGIQRGYSLRKENTPIGAAARAPLPSRARAGSNVQRCRAVFYKYGITIDATSDKIITATSRIATALVFLFMGFLPFYDFLDALFRLGARQHHLVAAARAVELYVHAHARHEPELFAARMRLLHFDNIVQPQVHVLTP